jgi:large subunit ribosomal protein L5
MKKIRIGKITLNMSTGEPGQRLEKAKKLLEIISGGKVIITKTHKRSTFGVAKGRQIGVMTTIRGPGTKEMLTRLLHAVENRLKPSQFDASGNFSFGIAEYIEIPGIEYSPEIGIMGLDVCVTLERPGYRVARRALSNRIGKSHRITPEEATEWARKELGVEVV